MDRSSSTIWVSCCLALAAWTGGERIATADPPVPPDVVTPVLRIDGAVRYALVNNPELDAIRQQHGIAAAQVVIARAYPFNPFYEARVRDATGPPSAGVTNVVPSEHWLFLEVEMRHQGRYRRQAAYAGLTRTDWEIAQQENDFAIRVIRAFDNVLLQQDRLRLLRQTVELNQDAAERVRRLVNAGRARPADLILAQSEVDDSRSLLSVGQTPLTTARYELRRALGVVTEPVEVEGTLEGPPLPGDAPLWIDRALERRADLRAREAGVAEADANVRLTVANRYGNPTIGPNYELDPTRVSMVGAQFNVPIPVLNTQRGQIQQRQAERDKAALQLRQTEVAVQQDVQAAVARYTAAQATLEYYDREVLPRLQRYLEQMQELFRLNDPGADVLRIIDVRRKVIRARDGRLSALFEVSQARADLAAAVGDFTLALPGCSTRETAEVTPATIP